MRIEKEFRDNENSPVLVRPDFRISEGTRITQVFWNADMRNRHTGLAQIAKDHDIDVNKLRPGQYVVFINSEKTILTVYTANNIIASYKSNHGRIDERTIAIIPETFQAKGKLDYDEALRDVLIKELTKKHRLIKTAVVEDAKKMIAHAKEVKQLRAPRKIYVRPEQQQLESANGN